MKQFQFLDTVEEIDLVIAERKHLMSQMVGNLYPSIIADEIAELQRMKEKLNESF